ncbi:DUF4124 domain-containing protein [Rhodoferax sp.]|uniref:DUF4124 domain-containing protein n=1 Tax=Rhodoferax sp. TaxID=50421 RepID=UPI0025E2577F|nr:DUF4124 domain-containing protein [Rhodoferax sp.]
MKPYKLLAMALGCALSWGAVAQWQWIDNSGSKVFSDRGPPPDIPAKNILRQPGGAPKNTPVAAPTVSASAALAPKISGVDKALEEKKKLAEDAEAAKKKIESEKTAAARAENCARAKQSKATFDSGIRIARINDKGEREILDDATRASETKRTQDVIASECK